MTPDISVVIPCYNDTHGLRSCLDAIARQTLPRERFEVIVVDNGSDTAPHWVSQVHAFARLLIEPTKGSYAARNTGVANSRGRILAFTDADCRPEPDWLENALRRFDSDPGCEAIGGAILLDRSTAPGAAELYEHTFVFRQERWVTERGFAATANLVVLRTAFDRVGWFNPTLRSAGDRDWGQRFTEAGGQMRYGRDCVVRHPPRKTISALVKKRRRLEAGFRAVAAGPGRSHAEIADARPRGARFALALLARPIDHDLTRPQAIQVLWVASIMGMVGLFERARLVLGGEARR